jgi:DNA-binding beta-propeller fold protein YncE
MKDRIIWPGPPEKARIKYLWALNGLRADQPGLLDVLTGSAGNSDFLAGPHGLFVDAGQRLYIADPAMKRVAIVDLKSSKFSYFQRAGGQDLSYPLCVAGTPEGDILVTDPELKKVFVFDGEGGYKSEFEGSFERPTGIAVDPARKRVYVSDTWAHKVYIYDTAGKRLGSIGKRGSGKGEFNYPTHIAVSRDGFIHVSDTGNFRVQIFTPEGRFYNAFGDAGDTFTHFDKLKGIAVDQEGHIYTADSAQDMIMIYDRQGRLLLFFGEKGQGYGQFYMPTGLFIDGQNRIYVSDTLNMRVQAFQFLGGD